MPFAKDPTPTETATLEQLDEIYFNRLHPFSKANAEVTQHRVAHFPITNGSGFSAVRQKQFTNAIHEMNLEVVVRKSQNFRKTAIVKNHLNAWRLTFHTTRQKLGIVAEQFPEDDPLSTEWINSILLYYCTHLKEHLSHLIDTSLLFSCSGNEVAASWLKGDGDISSGWDLLQNCIVEARKTITPNLCNSPYFVRALQCCSDFQQVAQLSWSISRLVNGMSNFPRPNGNAASGGTDNGLWISSMENIASPISALLQKTVFTGQSNELFTRREWVLLLIQLLISTMWLNSGTGEFDALFSTQKHNTSITSIVFLMRLMCGNTEGADVLLTTLVLQYVKERCNVFFPPHRTLQLLSLVGGTPSSAGSRETPLPRVKLSSCFLEKRSGLKHPIKGASPTPCDEADVLPEDGSDGDHSVAEAYRDLYQTFLKRMPNFLRSDVQVPLDFNTRNCVAAVAATQLLCWDISTPPQSMFWMTNPMEEAAGNDYSRGPAIATTNSSPGSKPAIASNSTPTVYHTPLKSEPNNKYYLPTVLHKVFCALLRPLFAELLVPPSGLANSRAVLSPEQQAAAAVLIQLADVSNSLWIPASRRLKAWDALCMGEQVQHNTDIGAKCFCNAVKIVLGEALYEGLKDVKPEEGLTLGDVVLRYLLAVENTFFTLTEMTITLESESFVYLRSLHITPLESVPSTTTSYATGPLHLCRSYFYESVQATLNRAHPAKGTGLLLEPLNANLSIYLFGLEKMPRGGSLHRLPRAAPPPAASAGRRGSPERPDRHRLRRDVFITSQQEYFSALRLVKCITDRDLFAQQYVSLLSERLLSQAPPGSISDEEFNANKISKEKETCLYLTNWLSDNTSFVEVHRLCSSFAPQTVVSRPAASGAEIKLHFNLLDWRQGNTEIIFEDTNQDTANPVTDTNGSNAPRSATAVLEQQRYQTGSSGTAPLLLPEDALLCLQKVEKDYISHHSTSSLEWCWDRAASSSFTIAFPSDGGRTITIHGTLFLQRLFLTIASQGRRGILMVELEKRSGKKEEQLRSTLKPCIERDGLVVYVDHATGVATEPRNAKFPPPGGPSAYCLALNYNWKRTTNQREYTYWPMMERRALEYRNVPAGAAGISSSTNSKLKKDRSRNIKVRIVQFMKSAKEMDSDELFEKVKTALSNSFEVNRRLFKVVVEGLINEEMVKRSPTSHGWLIYEA